jgi:hypothetical protein
MKPIITRYSNALSGNFQLSPSLHRTFISSSADIKTVGEFLSRKLERDDLGVEVGSINYVQNSSYFFIRTKALQDYTFLPEFSNESVEGIHPKSFKNYNLKEGDLIISKDSNIGEVVILDKDYPNYMPSGAIYRLPINENKYYLLAFLKHSFFREQLDKIVPKGATIRHAGKKFLDCKIPLPAKNADEIIKYVESLMKFIVQIEKVIKLKFTSINYLVRSELQDGQKPNKFQFEQPRLSDIVNWKRIDTGAYSETFKTIDFQLKNYNRGVFYIEPKKLKGGNTPSVRFIGDDESLKYKWITPTNCSDIGYILIDERISMPDENNLNENAMLLINRTSRGGRGEYVGIATFYDTKVYGEGHHNQGIYRITDYPDADLMFMTCFMNTDIMRKYCSYLCVGSKMKELKANHFLNMPFPNFSDELKKHIVSLFYKEQSTTFSHPDFFSETGIFQLHGVLKNLKAKLNSILDKIIDGEEIDTNEILCVQV